ncbi:MAG: nucleoside triphosphate pyrophosphatase [Acidobacteriota bacterium]
MPNPKKLILASGSQRRSEILNSLKLDFSISPSSIDERFHKDEAPADYIIRIARAKVVDVAKNLETGLVLGADTIVVFEGRIIGKPLNEENAKEILKVLAGRWHAVMTGVALYDIDSKKEVVDFEKTLVRFAPLSQDEIDWYISTGEYKGKAGGYAIQGYAAAFVEEIAGNYLNVVGLPVPLVYRLGKRLGFSLIDEIVT